MEHLIGILILFTLIVSIFWSDHTAKKDTMVGRKQREIEALRKRCADFEDSKAQIYMTIYGMGGPLNDNVKGYTKDQMRDFHQIIEDLNFVSDGDDV